MKQCSKCGEVLLDIKYLPSIDRLSCRCKRCSYVWHELPNDYKEETTQEDDELLLEISKAVRKVYSTESICEQ